MFRCYSHTIIGEREWEYQSVKFCDDRILTTVTLVSTNKYTP